MIFCFISCAAVFPGPRMRTAAERFCYTARRYDFSFRNLRAGFSRAAVANRGGAVLLYCAAPGRSHVHTQPFAFRAPLEGDESVKMSSMTPSRSSALTPAPAASRFGSVCLPKRQFLFNTNEPFALNSNFATYTKQSTSFFRSDTNERSPVFIHELLFTTPEPPISNMGSNLSRTIPHFDFSMRTGD